MLYYFEKSWIHEISIPEVIKYENKENKIIIVNRTICDSKNAVLCITLFINSGTFIFLAK